MPIIQLIGAFVTVGITSFLLFWVALKSNNQLADEVLAESIEDKNIRKERKKQLKAELKSQPLSWHGLMLSKWMSFGGGFYGVVAVLTYVVVEFNEVIDLLTSEASLWATISNLGIGDLVSFLVNSIMNFVTAIAWPAYWLNKIGRASVWVWFLVVYGGYVVGQFCAKNMINPFQQDSR